MLDNYVLKCVLVGIMVLLVFGVFNLPYGFYDLLRNSIFWGSIYIVYKIKDIQENHIVVFIALFVISGIVFNPVLKFELSKSIWVLVDIVFALIYGIFYLYCIKNDYI